MSVLLLIYNNNQVISSAHGLIQIMDIQLAIVLDTTTIQYTKRLQ